MTALFDIVSKLIDAIPSASAGGVVVETANMPQTQIVRFAMYCIAQGLWAKHRFKDDRGLAKALVGKVEAVFDPAALTIYGFKAHYWKNETPNSFQQKVSGIKKLLPNIVSDTQVSKEEIDVLKRAILYLQDPENESRERSMVKVASQLSIKFGDNVAKVRAAAGEQEEELDGKVAELTDKLKDTVKRMTGKLGTKVGAEVLALDKNMGNKAVYRMVRRDIVALYDQAVNKFLATKPNNIAYVHEVYKHMETLGFPFHKIPVFTKKVPLKLTMHAGKIEYLTESGKPLSASIPAGATKITFMKTYDDATGTGAYMSYTAPEAVSITRLYTKEHKTAAARSKFSKADTVVQNMDGYLTKWRKDLVSKDLYKKMGATIALMVYETGMRAGTRQKSAASATGVPTYGALSLRPRHLRITATSVSFSYEGKKGVKQEHKILLKDKWTKLLGKNLQEFKAGKKGDDLIFSFINERGTIKPMAPNRMTAYLNSTGYTVGLHKIRHVKGTALVIDLLGKLTFKPTVAESRNITAKQKAAEEFIKTKVIMPVAALLGHKNKDKLAWRTSIGSYINPAPIIAFFTENGLRLPNWLPTKIEE